MCLNCPISLFVRKQACRWRGAGSVELRNSNLEGSLWRVARRRFSLPHRGKWPRFLEYVVPYSTRLEQSVALSRSLSYTHKLDSWLVCRSLSEIALQCTTRVTYAGERPNVPSVIAGRGNAFLAFDRADPFWTGVMRGSAFNDPTPPIHHARLSFMST